MASATRDPASLTRTGSEVTGLTFIGMIVAYLAAKFDPSLPEAMKQAIIGAVIAGGSVIMSHLRNRSHNAG